MDLNRDSDLFVLEWGLRISISFFFKVLQGILMSGLNWELFGLIEQFPTENNSEVLDQLRKGCRDAESLGVRRGSVGICLALPSSLHLETEATPACGPGYPKPGDIRAQGSAHWLRLGSPAVGPGYHICPGCWG